MSSVDFEEIVLLDVSSIDGDETKEIVGLAQSYYVPEAQSFIHEAGLISGVSYEDEIGPDGSPVDKPTSADGSPVDGPYIKNGILYIQRGSTKGVYSYAPDSKDSSPVDWANIIDSIWLNGYMRVASTVLYIAQEHHMLNLYVGYDNGYIKFMLNDSWES